MADAASPGTVRCSVLGPLHVEVDAAPVRIRPGHPEHLLAVLLAAQGDFVSVDQLVDRLWRDRPPSAAASTLHSHVRAVRSALGAGAHVLANERGRGYRIRLAPADPEGATLDLLEFRSHVAAARALVRGEEHDAARSELRCALELWRADQALPELVDDLDARSLVVELTSLREWAEQQSVDLAMRSGDPAAVVPDLEAALARDPADQRAAARLMRAYAASGRPERATAVYGELVRHLRERSGDVPLPELAELDGRILRHDPAVVGLSPGPVVTDPADAPAPPTLGAEMTSFVGRGAESDQLAAAIAGSRIVTLVGAGGCGKTRLAREVARRAAPAGGVRLAQLAGVDEGDAAAVVDASAAAFGVDARSAGELAAHVAADAREQLLVLDNGEHVLDALAVLTVTLLERAPSLRVLVTSREALHLPGERIVPLKPLPTAVAGAEGPSDGARLFVTRAVDAGWAADPEEVLGQPDSSRAVERICARLDGLPLAIELVAPLAGMYSLDDLERRLVEQPDVARPVRSPHLRQRTLGEVLDWSVARLDEHEHAALLAASTFTGTFTPEAFGAVVGRTAPGGRADAVGLLDALVSRSLLSPVVDDGPSRFRLLETVRAHTRRLARATGVADELAEAHARHHADHAAAAEHRLDELADLREAVLWCVESGRDELALRILDGVGVRLYRLALPASVVAWLERLGAGDGPHAPVALDLRATHALFSGDYEHLDRIAERTLAALVDAGDADRAARARVIAAFSFVLAGRGDDADRLLSELRADSHALDEWLGAWADAVEGLVARRAGHLDDAEAASRRALDAFVGRGDRLGTLLPTLNLGRVACERGDLDAGLGLLDRGTVIADGLGDHLGRTLGHAYAARVLLEAGRVDDAVDRLRLGLDSARSAPNRVLVASLLDYAAGALTVAGDDEAAAALVGAGGGCRPGGGRDPLGLSAPARERLGSAHFDAVAADGATRDLEAAIDMAITRLGSVVVP